MKKLITALGAASIAAAVLAPVAQAADDQTYHAVTTVTWEGADCIRVQQVGDRLEVCGGSYQVAEDVVSGQNFGINPMKGQSTDMACEIWIDDQFAYEDHTRGREGTDVNCLLSKG